MDERRDVQAALADMDRKLREIQRELDLVSRAPPDASATPAADPAPDPGPSAATVEAQAEAEAIVDRARSEAARIVDEAAEQVAAIGAQIDEFQRLRDELQRSAEALVAEYERAVRPAGPAPARQDEGRQFEGEIVLDAGPFADIAALGTVERALAGLAATEDVYVRGLQGNRALIDVRLAGPVHLLEELRRALPFGFDLVEIGYGRITIEVAAPGPAPPADSR